jgi:hypothetical protein
MVPNKDEVRRQKRERERVEREANYVKGCG